MPESAVFLEEKQRIYLWLALHRYGNCSSPPLTSPPKCAAMLMPGKIETANPMSMEHIQAHIARGDG